MNVKLIYPIGAVLIILGVATCNYYYQKKNQERVILDDKSVGYKNGDTVRIYSPNGVDYGTRIPDKPRLSIWIRSWFPKEGRGSFKNYFDLIKLNDHQYLFLGKDGLGNTFDSSIITINK